MPPRGCAIQACRTDRRAAEEKPKRPPDAMCDRASFGVIQAHSSRLATETAAITPSDCPEASGHGCGPWLRAVDSVVTAERTTFSSAEHVFSLSSLHRETRVEVRVRSIAPRKTHARRPTPADASPHTHAHTRNLEGHTDARARSRDGIEFGPADNRIHHGLGGHTDLSRLPTKPGCPTRRARRGSGESGRGQLRIRWPLKVREREATRAGGGRKGADGCSAVSSSFTQRVHAERESHCRGGSRFSVPRRGTPLGHRLSSHAMRLEGSVGPTPTRPCVALRNVPRHCGATRR